MYQLLCHVNVHVPADTCLTRTADRAILDFVPGMKRTVVITVKYYDNFNDFGTPISVRYLVLFTIRNREAETAAIFNAKDVGRTGPRVQQATIYFANPFILLLYIILYCRTFVFLNNYYVRVYPRLSASKCAWLRNPAIPRPPRDE